MPPMAIPATRTGLPTPTKPALWRLRRIAVRPKPMRPSGAGFAEVSRRIVDATARAWRSDIGVPAPGGPGEAVSTRFKSPLRHARTGPYTRVSRACEPRSHGANMLERGRGRPPDRLHLRIQAAPLREVLPPAAAGGRWDGRDLPRPRPGRGR